MSLEYIDAHSHTLYAHHIKMLCCATSYESWGDILALSHESNVLKAIGLHPWFIASRPEDWFEYLHTLLNEDISVSLGECGLDFYKRENVAEQVAVFEKHLELAVQYNRPVSIHSVHCWPEMIPLLKKYALPKGSLMHRFSGSVEIAKQCLAEGLYISVGPELFLQPSKKKKRLVEELPLHSLLIESDAEDDTESPLSLLKRVYNEVAQIKKCPIVEIQEQMASNFSHWG